MAEALQYDIITNALTAADYLLLRRSVGFYEQSPQMAQASLDGSLYVIHIEAGGRAIGMARVLGDGAQVFVIQDVVVLPQYQGRGLGRALMQDVLRYIKNSATHPGRAMVILFAFKGKEEFYKKFGFFVRPSENMGPGMMRFFERA